MTRTGIIAEQVTHPESEHAIKLVLRDYDLGLTLNCGQAFRWRRTGPYWEGVIGPHWVRFSISERADQDRQNSTEAGRQVEIVAETAEPIEDWDWLRTYLQTDLDLAAVLAGFPNDEPMRGAVAACRGLRLLRQDPWECLASFILSSTKQIVQIQQIIRLLCTRLGEPLPVLSGHEPAYTFPSPARLAGCTEAELRACKMGFRAPYLLETAKRIDSGDLQLDALRYRTVEEARTALMHLPGVGRKIADCVLLFAYGFQSAFPVDVWVMKGLRELYFRRRRVKLPRLLSFSRTHFGPFGGYAQQYLFHYMRTRSMKSKNAGPD